MATDWTAWHRRHYADPGSEVALRLAEVQRQIEAALDAQPSGPVRVVSLCAGDGRDLLGVLERRPDAGRVNAVLVERDPDLAATARARARTIGDSIAVRCADAADVTSYAAGLPADLVLLCGVLGNVSDADVRRTIEAMAHVCADGGRVIWTRSTRAPDLTPNVRAWFADNGFAETSFVTWEVGPASVGVHEHVAPRVADPPPSPFFTFVR